MSPETDEALETLKMNFHNPKLQRIFNDKRKILDLDSATYAILERELKEAIEDIQKLEIFLKKNHCAVLIPRYSRIRELGNHKDLCMYWCPENLKIMCLKRLWNQPDGGYIVLYEKPLLEESRTTIRLAGYQLDNLLEAIIEEKIKKPYL